MHQFSFRGWGGGGGISEIDERQLCMGDNKICCTGENAFKVRQLSIFFIFDKNYYVILQLNCVVNVNCNQTYCICEVFSLRHSVTASVKNRNPFHIKLFLSTPTVSRDIDWCIPWSIHNKTSEKSNTSPIHNLVSISFICNCCLDDVLKKFEPFVEFL